MKAIIVIDLPENNLFKTVNDLYDKLKEYRCVLKPMPEIMTIEKADIGHISYRSGWNDCIEEIEDGL